MGSEDLQALNEQLRTLGEPANRIVMSPVMVSYMQQVDHRSRHWYWRLWWRVRYAPADLRDWIASLRGE